MRGHDQIGKCIETHEGLHDEYNFNFYILYTITGKFKKIHSIPNSALVAKRRTVPIKD